MLKDRSFIQVATFAKLPTLGNKDTLYFVIADNAFYVWHTWAYQEYVPPTPSP